MQRTKHTALLLRSAGPRWRRRPSLRRTVGVLLPLTNPGRDGSAKVTADSCRRICRAPSGALGRSSLRLCRCQPRCSPRRARGLGPSSGGGRTSAPPRPCLPTAVCELHIKVHGARPGWRLLARARQLRRSTTGCGKCQGPEERLCASFLERVDDRRCLCRLLPRKPRSPPFLARPELQQQIRPASARLTLSPRQRASLVRKYNPLPSPPKLLKTLQRAGYAGCAVLLTAPCGLPARRQNPRWPYSLS